MKHDDVNAVTIFRSGDLTRDDVIIAIVNSISILRNSIDLEEAREIHEELIVSIPNGMSCFPDLEVFLTEPYFGYDFLEHYISIDYYVDFTPIYQGKSRHLSKIITSNGLNLDIDVIIVQLENSKWDALGKSHLHLGYDCKVSQVIQATLTEISH